MKIFIGQVFTGITGICGGPAKFALEIPGIGIIPAKDIEDKKEFAYVELDRKQLKKFRKMIDKEIGHAKDNDETKNYLE